MKTDSELLQFYNATLQPILEPLEKFRIEKLAKAKLNFYLSLPFFCVLLIGIFFENKLIIVLSFVVGSFFLGSFIYEFVGMVNYLKKHFKYKVMSEILNFLFEDYEYIPNQKIAKSVLSKSMLFPINISYIDGEDFMRFRMGETSIMFCETLAYTVKSKIKFEGLFISASFNKSFKSKTFVIHRSIKNYYRTALKFFLNDIKVVKLEDKSFSNEFQIYGTDQVEARYILTPSLMQRILDYKIKTDKNISLSFVDNRLYCAIPKYSNHFEPAIFRSFNFEFIKYTIAPLKLYTDLVEDLNLNLRIWSKHD
ncbi:MAG: DUF3137 domain-containing protein [Bacteroidales bacterium]